MNDTIEQAITAVLDAYRVAKQNPGNDELVAKWKARSIEYGQMTVELDDGGINPHSSSSHAKAASTKGKESVMLMKPDTWRAIFLGAVILILGAVGSAFILGGFRVYVRVSGLSTQMRALSSQERLTDETLLDQSKRITQVSQQVTLASENNLKQSGFLEKVGNQNKEELKSDVAKAQSTISTLGTQMTGIQKAQATLGTQIAGVQTESGSIKEVVRDLYTRVGGVEKKLGEMDTKLSGMDKKLTQIAERLLTTTSPERSDIELSLNHYMEDLPPEASLSSRSR